MTPMVYKKVGAGRVSVTSDYSSITDVTIKESLSHYGLTAMTTCGWFLRYVTNWPLAEADAVPLAEGL